MTNLLNDLDSATAAYLKGMQGGQNGLFWLNRARRLAPDDPRIELEIARQELSSGVRGAKLAYSIFLSLAERYDIAPAWVGAAVSAQILGDAGAAANALDSLLNQHCMPSDEGFSTFVQHVAVVAGYDGYQGYNAQGNLVSSGAGKLLGAKSNLDTIERVDGLVELDGGGLSGWATCPAHPDLRPDLTVKDSQNRTIVVKCSSPLPTDKFTPFLYRYKFRIPAAKIKELSPPLTVSDSRNRPLLGSPIDPKSAHYPPVNASSRGKPPEVNPRFAPLALIMPVYKGVSETKAAINSVLGSISTNVRFIIVNDASPERALSEWLIKLTQEHKIELIQHTQNLGFCAAVNTGFSQAVGYDVLLLNSDILLPNGVIETLRQAAYSDAAIGTVTPLSNEATICSYPDVVSGNAMPDLATATQYSCLAKLVNGESTTEIPTGVGFCMYIRHDCLSITGHFRAEIFSQGYGEENDFCIRARHLGFKHVVATGAYVGHQGGTSFKHAANALMNRNSKILNKLYPGYQQLVKKHIKENPIAPFRALLDEARLCEIQKGKASVLFISHAHGGGVTKYISHAISKIREQGLNPLLLTTKFPKNAKKFSYPWPSLLCAGDPQEYPNLSFTLPKDFTALVTLLQKLNVVRVEMHHMLGQNNAIRDLAATLGVPQCITIHDYASFCPRVNLLNRLNSTSQLRYCGEPDINGCTKCCSQDKEGIFETLPIKKLLTRSYREFRSAESVVAPTSDVARRLSRHFPDIVPRQTPWEDDSVPITLNKPRSGKRRISLIGGIGPHKGFHILLDCAQDIRRRSLPLEFIVIGSSADDSLLLEAGVLISGAYKADEVQELITDAQSDLAFVPSICPETWCFALSEAWRAGLYTVVFDLGAQAERVRSTGRGAILPLGLPPERINNALMSITF